MENIILKQKLIENNKNLTRLCKKMCNNMYDAEDLYQDTVLSICRFWGKYNPDLPFDKWVYSICVNTYRNKYRKYKSSPQIMDFESNEEKDNKINNIEDKDSVNYDNSIMLKQLINNLNKDKKEVVILFYFQDFSVKEVATILRIPEGTVKKRLYSARQYIKERWNTHE